MENKDNIVDKDRYQLPDEILTYVSKLMGSTGGYSLPTVIETEFYTKDALDRILEKNKIVSSYKTYDGNKITLIDGLIRFSDSISFLYFIKRKDENTYKFYTICKEESSSGMIFFLNSYKKFKTI